MNGLDQHLALYRSLVQQEQYRQQQRRQQLPIAAFPLSVVSLLPRPQMNQLVGWPVMVPSQPFCMIHHPHYLDPFGHSQRRTMQISQEEQARVFRDFRAAVTSKLSNTRTPLDIARRNLDATRNNYKEDGGGENAEHGELSNSNDDSSDEEQYSSTSSTNAPMSSSRFQPDGKPNGISEGTKWMAMYEQLRVYKKRWGDCIVPRGYALNSSLACWVAEQRKQYNRRNAGKVCSITTERIRLLNELGFTWNAQEAAWDRQLGDLRRFQAEYGHCNVPHDHPKYPKLGIWTKEQRRHYSLMQQRKKSHMNPQRVADLESIGFCWDTHEANWIERLRELVEYKARFGNCAVPTTFSENPRLGTWVHHQRRQYRLLHEGKPSHITTERIEVLDRIGFIWYPRSHSISTASQADETTATSSDVEIDGTNVDLRPRKRQRSGMTIT